MLDDALFRLLSAFVKAEVVLVNSREGCRCPLPEHWRTVIRRDTRKQGTGNTGECSGGTTNRDRHGLLSGRLIAPLLTHSTPVGLDGKKGSRLGHSLAGLTPAGLATEPWQAWVDIGWCVPPQGSRNIWAEDNEQRGGHMAKDVSPPVPTHHAGLSSKSAAFQCAIELLRGQLNQEIPPRTRCVSMVAILGDGVAS